MGRHLDFGWCDLADVLVENNDDIRLYDIKLGKLHVDGCIVQHAKAR
jgi:hypothetical protein